MGARVANQRVDRRGHSEPSNRIKKPGLVDLLVSCQQELKDLAALLGPTATPAP